jgi:hypothetical protein
MKKKYIMLILVVLLTMAMTTTAFAKTGKGNPEGTVIEVEMDGEVCVSITIETEEDGTLKIYVPEGFDCSTLIGTVVVAKGEWTTEIVDDVEIVVFIAEWVKEADLDDDDGEGEGWGAGGVYCAEGSSKYYQHPLAQKIVDKYSADYPAVTTEWVMEKKCDGFGFGQIMLAIQTELAYQKKGEPGACVDVITDPPDPGDPSADPPGDDPVDEDLCAGQWLNKRKGGQGWGQIWKENGLVKNEKADKVPYGQFKKAEKQQKGPKEDKNSNGKGPEKGPDHPKNNKPDKGNKNKNQDDEGE